MEREEIRRIVLSMDKVRGSAVEDLREKLVPLGAAVLPEFLDLYPVLKRWESRNAIVYTAIKFSRSRPEAAALAKQPLNDRSGRVRYFAAMLLAVGQDPTSIADLEPLLDHAN